MDIKEFAAMLDGRQYRNEITKEEEKLAKELGFVVVFGASDDLMEFRGAINDEVDCYKGGTGYIRKDGLLEICEEECKYFKSAKKKAKEITAHWCKEDADGFTWSYETEFPHQTFKIFDDDEKYCLGIVFDIESL
jgi:hypothetical protein